MAPDDKKEASEQPATPDQDPRRDSLGVIRQFGAYTAPLLIATLTGRNYAHAASIRP